MILESISSKTLENFDELFMCCAETFFGCSSLLMFGVQAYSCIHLFPCKDITGFLNHYYISSYMLLEETQSRRFHVKSDLSKLPISDFDTLFFALMTLTSNSREHLRMLKIKIMSKNLSKLKRKWTKCSLLSLTRRY